MEKVLVAILSPGDVRHELSLLLPTLAKSEYQVDVMYSYVTGTDKNREYISDKFLEDGYMRLIMIDADNPPTKNPLELIGLDLDVVACPTPMFVNNTLCWNVANVVADGYKTLRPPVSKGLQECDRVGFGCVVLSRECVRETMSLNPYTSREDGEGEDFSFCRHAKSLRKSIFVHWDYPCMHFKTINLLDIIDY